MLLNIDRENLIKLLQDGEYEVSISYHGLRPYVCHKLLKKAANMTDNSDIILEKAIFEAKADAFNNKKNK